MENEEEEQVVVAATEEVEGRGRGGTVESADIMQRALFSRPEVQGKPDPR